MTANRELKRRIRLRMRASGENYMQARRAVVAFTEPVRHLPRPDRSTVEMSVPAAPDWTPRAQVLLRSAESWAIRYRHTWVGTEHLLLAMAEEKDGVAGQVLERLGAADAARTEVLKILGDESYYTAGELVLDDEGNPILDETTGQYVHRFIPPSKD